MCIFILADGIMIGIGDEVIFTVAFLPLIFIPVYLLMYTMRNFFTRLRGTQIVTKIIFTEISICFSEPSLQPLAGEGLQDLPRESFNHADYTCPICINQIDLPVETNCGHKFCGMVFCQCT